MLQIARTNLLIFVEEHVNQKLSKALDLKKRGANKHEKKQVTNATNESAQYLLPSQQQSQNRVSTNNQLEDTN